MSARPGSTPAAGHGIMSGRTRTPLTAGGPRRAGGSVETQRFITPSFEVSEVCGLVYGTGSVGNPASGTRELLLDLHLPAGPGSGGRRPALVVLHGGGFTGGSRDNPGPASLCRAYAGRGYVAASIDYRLAGDDPTGGPGSTPGATVIERTVNAAVRDAAKAVRWLRTNADRYRIDPDRIAVAGSSAGAVAALLMANERPEVVGDGARVGAIVDLWGGMYGGESLVVAGAPPVFIAHGTGDDTVPMEASQTLVARLEAAGVPHRFVAIERCGHPCWTGFFTTLLDGRTVDRHCAEFLYEHLRLAGLNGRR